MTLEIPNGGFTCSSFYIHNQSSHPYSVPHIVFTYSGIYLSSKPSMYSQWWEASIKSIKKTVWKVWRNAKKTTGHFLRFTTPNRQIWDLCILLSPSVILSTTLAESIKTKLLSISKVASILMEVMDLDLFVSHIPEQFTAPWLHFQCLVDLLRKSKEL